MITTARRIAAAAVLLASFMAIDSASADETVVVQLKNGRQLHGTVDARSTDAKLWLRAKQGTVVVFQLIAREEIVEMRDASDAADASHGQNLNAALTFAEQARLALFGASSVNQ